MNSFQLRIAGNFNAISTDPGISLKTWGTPGQYFWSAAVRPGNNTSTYNLTGFKNVNIFGVTVNGIVRANSNSTQCAVVYDWGFSLGINGTPPLISGEKTTSPDGWNLNTTTTAVSTYFLSKDTNSVRLSDPITSVKSIEFFTLYAQGDGAEFLNQVEINYLLNFTFYYRYEGEEY
jgi:hypothetical protein